MEAKLVECLINNLKRHFGELVISRGKNHAFWSMNINIMEDKKVEVKKKQKLFKAIEAFGKYINEK